MGVPKWKKLDLLWAQAIRARDGELCQYDRKNAGTAAHHIFSRRHKTTRWDPDNGILLCFYCHIRIAHEDPEIFRDFVVSRLGAEKFAKLKLKAQAISGSVDVRLWELMLTEYIKEVKRAAESRALGPRAFVGRT